MQSENKIKIAIVGYGNIGKFVVDAVDAAPDMSLSYILRREKTDDPRVVTSVSDIKDVNVAILCVPSQYALETALPILRAGIHTVDCFDMHEKIWDTRLALDAVAKENDCVAITAVGWDPGTDSLLRVLFEVMAPKGITYTNFGPGMSMGHSTAVKNMQGVIDALSITMPKGGGVHARLVYVVAEPGFDQIAIADRIRKDEYFIGQDTSVFFVDSIDPLMDKGHGVRMERKGVSGVTDNQLLSFDMRVHNPAMTAQVMVNMARAAMIQFPGAYTMPEIPLIDALPGSREDIIKRLV